MRRYERISKSKTPSAEFAEAIIARAVGEMGATAFAAAMFQSLAIIGALAERGLIDPRRVAAWADFFATSQTGGVAPDIGAGAAAALGNFSSVIRAMADKAQANSPVLQ